MIFCIPSIPMCSNELVALIWTEGFAKCPRINTDTLGLVLAGESIEERRSDPRLEYKPTTDVGSRHCSGIDH